MGRGDVGESPRVVHMGRGDVGGLTWVPAGVHEPLRNANMGRAGVQKRCCGFYIGACRCANTAYMLQHEVLQMCALPQDRSSALVLICMRLSWNHFTDNGAELILYLRYLYVMMNNPSEYVLFFDV